MCDCVNEYKNLAQQKQTQKNTTYFATAFLLLKGREVTKYKGRLRTSTLKQGHKQNFYCNFLIYLNTLHIYCHYWSTVQYKIQVSTYQRCQPGRNFRPGPQNCFSARPGPQSMYYKICTVQFVLKYYSKINIII